MCFRRLSCRPNPEIKPKELGRTGHIFPRRAMDGGVLRLAGHTEATVDLARLAGFEPAGVLVEIMNEDGEMARLPDLQKIARRFDMKLISIRDLIAYRLKHDSLIRKEVTVKMPTNWGEFDMTAVTQTDTGEPHLALSKGTWDEDDTVLVRVHSSCVTGDIFGSCRCDCGPQLHKAMEMIEREGKGVVLRSEEHTSGLQSLMRI